MPTQIDYNNMEEAQFRSMLREFIIAECPQEIRFRPRRLRRAETQEWMNRLAKKGWIAPGWPREYGGMGLDIAHQVIYQDEFDKAGVGRFPDQGIVMLGPILQRYGTEEQKVTHLPRILSGQTVWCQGYSEPGSGSDLASLRTSAVLEGDNYVINGQKIWTTLAQDADWIFLLVRTDPSARPQNGITFIIADIRTPGITVRPIKTLSGEEEFCEVFLDDVVVPASNVVGEVNKGWDVAKALLGFERLMVGSPRQPALVFSRLKAMVGDLATAGDAYWMEELSSLQLDVEDLSQLYEVCAMKLQAGQELGPEVSILKIISTELYQRITEKMLEALQASAMVQGSVSLGSVEVDPLAYYYQSRPSTIYGGANEIQRNILAKAVLGMPRE